LLLRRLCWHEPHVGSGNRLANRLGVGHIVLLPFDIGLHVSRWHQPNGMTDRLKFARPMVRRGASLDSNQAWRQLLKERQDVATLQLATDDHPAGGINSVHSISSPARIRMSCTAPATWRWTKNPSSFRSRTSGIVSGSTRTMTRAPTNSQRSASNTAPNPASI